MAEAAATTAMMTNWISIFLTIHEGEEARGGQEPDREWNILFKEVQHFPIVSGCIGNENLDFYAHRRRYKRSSSSMHYQDVLLLAQKIHSQMHDEKTLTTRTENVLDAVCSKGMESSIDGTVTKAPVTHSWDVYRTMP